MRFTLMLECYRVFHLDLVCFGTAKESNVGAEEREAWNKYYGKLRKRHDYQPDHLRTVLHVETRMAPPPQTEDDLAPRKKVSSVQRSHRDERPAGTHWMIVVLFWLLVLVVLVSLYKWVR